MGVVSSMVDWMAGNEQTSKQLRAQSAENALNRQFSEHMYERQWEDTLKNYPALLQMQSDADFNKWKNQFNIESAYNSQGSQVARNLVAGINPAAQGSALTQGVSVSSGGVAPPPSIHGSPLGGSISPVGLPHHFDLDLFAQLGQFAKDISQAGVNQKTIDKVVADTEKLLSEKDLNESLKAYQDIQNGIKQVFGYKRESLELSNIIKNSYKAESEGDYAKAAALQQKALERLNNSSAAINEAELPFVAKRIKSEIDRNQAAVRESNAKAFESSQAGNYFREQGLTIKALRNWQVGFQQAITEQEQVKSFVERNTMWEQTEGKLNELRAVGLLPDKIEQDIIKAKKENDWYTVKQLLGIVDTGVKVYAAKKGAVNAGAYIDVQDARNDIMREYNQVYQDAHGNYHKQVKGFAPWNQ